MYILYARTLFVYARVRTYRRGLRVVGSNVQGNARASRSGTGKSRFHAFFVYLLVHDKSGSLFCSEPLFVFNQEFVTIEKLLSSLQIQLSWQTMLCVMLVAYAILLPFFCKFLKTELYKKIYSISFNIFGKKINDEQENT